MKIIRLVLAIAIMATPLVSSHVLAQSAAWKDCIDRTTTNTEWDACGGAEISRQEARLDLAWKKAFSCFDRTNPGGREAKQSFLLEQRTWIQFKDSACRFYFPSKDGEPPYFGREGEVLNAPLCKATIIEDRSRWLEGFAKDCAGH